MAGVTLVGLEVTVVASPLFEVGLETFGRAGLAEFDDVLCAAMDDGGTELMVEMLGRAYGGKFCLTSARSLSRWKPH